MTDRRTPLHYAAARSKSPVIRVLLDYKADFNLKDKLGRTPLHVAAENASPDCCEALLERGAKTEVKDNSNLTPLMTAIVSFRPKNVLKLLRNGASLDDFNSEKYQSPLVLHQGAGVHNRIAIFANGAFEMRANGKVKRYISPPGEPFHWAAGQGNLALLKYLYEERLSKEEKKRIGAIDLNAAVLSRNQEIVDYLLQIGVDINATTGGLSMLSVAISNRDFEIAHYLMQRGVRVNGATRSADSPLLQATKWLSQTHDTIYVPKGTLGSRTIFIQDANAVYTVFEDVSGQIQKSRSQDKVNILKLIRELVAKGADVKAVNSSGESPMRNVLAESEIFKLFLGKGTDAKTPLLRGDSYLMHTANMSPETAESLIRAGLNVNGKTNSGATPLIQAVKFFNSEVAKVLLKHGADHKASDSTGKTALYYATQNGYAPILKLLKAAGVTR